MFVEKSDKTKNKEQNIRSKNGVSRISDPDTINWQFFGKTKAEAYASWHQTVL